MLVSAEVWFDCSDVARRRGCEPVRRAPTADGPIRFQKQNRPLSRAALGVLSSIRSSSAGADGSEGLVFGRALQVALAADDERREDLRVGQVGVLIAVEVTIEPVGLGADETNEDLRHLLRV